MQTITHSEGVVADLDLESVLADLEMDGLEAAAPQDGEVIETIGEVTEEVSDAEILEVISEREDEIAPEVEAVSEVIPEIGELELDEDEERALTNALDSAEVYASQESETTMGDPAEESTEAAAEPERKLKKAKAKTAGTGTPRVKVSIESLPAERFVLSTSDTPADLEANKAEVLATRPKQVKIAEKFDNVIGALAAGRAPSVYVMKCFAVLDKRGEVTSADLVAALSVDYELGTARSQAGQIMELFRVLGIASRDKQTLKLYPDSSYAAQLRTLLTA